MHMLGVRYLKVPATTYVLQFRGGRVQRQGAGLSFYYFAPTSVIALVPISSVDVPFAFAEVSSDFQDVTVQGMMTYRVRDAARLATLLDYSVDAWKRYQSDDPSKLADRLVQSAQTAAHAFIQSRPLREVLISSAALVQAVGDALHKSETIAQLGLEILDLAISSLKPDPEMAKALQAQARELLLKEADEAIYERRNSAVELERTIREAELNTEIAVAQKRRQVRETEMQAEIAVEQQRAAFVDSKVANERKEAESRAEALRAMLEPVRDVDWRTLLAMQGHMQSEMLISSAFDQLAKNAGRIGELNITPDLLATLAKKKGG